MRTIVRGLLVVLVTCGGVTLLALEGRVVVVVDTRDGAGAPRRTRTWIADEGGASWIEAADPERPFLLDLRRDPTLTLERDGSRRACRAAIEPNPDGHRHIRHLLAERYGWADRWIGLLADTTGSLAVRVECA